MRNVISKILSVLLVIVFVLIIIAGAMCVYAWENHSLFPPTGLGTMFEYTITLESTEYELGEEIKLNLSLSRGDLLVKYIADGNVHIKLMESPYYEIVGDGELVITDFDDPKYMNGIFSEAKEQIKYTFTVKVNEPTVLAQKLVFKAKFTPTKNLERYNLPDEEYFYAMREIDFLADNTGVMFSGYSYAKYLNDGEYYSAEFLFNQSLEREYKYGVPLSELTHRAACLAGGYEIGLSAESKRAEQPIIYYMSPNLSLEVWHLYNEPMFEKFYELSHTDTKGAAAALLGILVEEGYITDEEYSREKALLEQFEVGRIYSDDLHSYFHFVPADQREFYETRIKFTTVGP